MRAREITCVAAAVLVTTACAPSLGVPGPQEIQAWAVYFDGERGLAEIEQYGDLFDRVSLFAYELDPTGNPVPAPNLTAMTGPFLRLAREQGFEPWVTLVNDVRYDDSVVAKDSTLVHELLVNEERRAAHVQELAQQVAEAGFSGLHLDYERVPESDSAAYQTFVAELGRELRHRGIELEVVVEPVQGPLPAERSASVVVMAYDLFGPHSEPGPRSTPDFIADLGVRGAGDSSAALAIAVGGFAWDSVGDVDPVDWTSAQQLAAQALRTARDSAEVPSARLGDGTEIWFEDPRSLLPKWRAAWQAGFRRLAVWRLGGNDQRLFDLLRQIK
jgi:spore germination protein YaaH